MIHSHLKRAALHAVVIALLSACGGGSDVVELPFSRIDGPWSRGEPSQTYVINDDAEWDRVWTYQVALSGSPPRPLPPPVDFSSRTVLGIDQGVHTTICASLRITRVLRSEEEVRVEYRVSIFSAGTQCFFGRTPLTDFVSIPKTLGKVSFVRVDD